MAYHCPRCGETVFRTSGGRYFGCIGSLLAMAFSGFACPRCGPIPGHEFTPEERSSMTLGRVGLIIGAIVAFIVFIGLIILINAK
jgi:predicted RNA-binding Zn-ribbon protein involved in translation (DUF1610 family)